VLVRDGRGLTTLSDVCGIVGYVGHRSALEVVLEGLRRLEYRGYDSSGVAVLDGTGGLAVERKAGRLANLEARLDEVGRERFAGTTGMGHTRWATHGAPTDPNAHPHRDSSGRVAVVHNGIIENFAQLRAELEAAGVELTSQTDTETAAHLIARAYDGVGPDSSPATKGDLVKMNKIFMDVIGARAVGGLQKRFVDAGGGKAGLDAVDKEVRRLVEAQVQEAEIKESAARAAETTAAKAARFQNELDRVTQKVMAVHGNKSITIKASLALMVNIKIAAATNKKIAEATFIRP